MLPLLKILHKNKNLPIQSLIIYIIGQPPQNKGYWIKNKKIKC